MPTFITLKDTDNSRELFVCVDHVTTVEVNTIRNPSHPNVALHFMGGSLLELSEREGLQFLEAATKLGLFQYKPR